MRGIGRISLAVLASLFGACGNDLIPDSGPGPLCEAGAVMSALAAAPSGSTVTLGTCAIEGPLLVPAGVTLLGAGAEHTRITGGGSNLVELATDGGDITLRGVRIDSSAKVALRITGSGAAHVHFVDIHADSGLGLAAEGASVVEVTESEITGGVNASNAANASGGLATHGVVLIRVAQATLTNVTVRGFAKFGALLFESNTTWSHGGTPENAGVGLLANGGHTTLSDFDANRIYQGVGIEPPYGVVAAANAVLDSDRLQVNESQGYGLVVDHASGSHTLLSASHNQVTGVWAQYAHDLSLSGMIESNQLAGVLALSSQNLTVQNATVRATVDVVRLMGAMPVHVGDGLHLVGSQAGLLVEDTTLADNARVGALLDLGGMTLLPSALERVSVSAAGTALGVVMQNGSAPANWDEGVVRAGATVANDAAFSGMLGTVEGIGPCWMPAVDLANGGVSALIGP